MGIFTERTGAAGGVVDPSLIYLVGRLWQRLMQRKVRSHRRRDHDAHFVPLFRLERLAARHPSHSPEILGKRAACGKASS